MNRRHFHRTVLLILAFFATMQSYGKTHVIRPDSVTITGRITCAGEPVSDVIVSDGVLFTSTDKNGTYELRSKKFQGTVFMISPSGYEPVCQKGILPQFWAHLDSKHPEACEVHDFCLKKVDNTRHRMIISTGTQLASRNDDLLQLKRIFIPAVRSTANEVKCDSCAVYSIIVGDIGISRYWYSADFDLSDAMRAFTTFKYPTMLYTAMGDGDHDGATPFGGLTDYNSERMYVMTCGPKYYSMNIGKVHYVVLDNTVYRNEPGEGNYPTDIVGKQNYDKFVTLDQLEWLRKDLSYVRDTLTPIVVFLHHPVFKTGNKGSVIKQFTTKEQTDSLLNCFKGRHNIHFFTGHVNRRKVSEAKRLHMIEHNMCNASGHSWESIDAGYKHMCPDGSDPGFDVLDALGDSLTWKYRTELNGDMQFRIYDMNAVSKHYASSYDSRGFFKENQVRTDYAADSFKNFIYINYWGYEPGTKLEVTEDGKPLKVKSVLQDDPMFTSSLTISSFKNNRSRNRKGSYGKTTCQHMFRAKCEKDSTTVVVKATDRFGRECIDSILRPGSFDFSGEIPKKKK